MFKNMNNFPVIVDGREYWISRSIATVGFVFSVNEKQEPIVLITKRGKGTPNYQGYWCCPCGYLDYNETVKECCIREIKEETGVDVSYTLIEDNLGYNDDPDETRQDVTFRFIFYSSTYFTQRFDTSNSEPDEVEEVKWIKLDEINNYQFAFNHENLIKEAASKIF